jgi:uncharacterized protein (DUF885 family)
MARFGSQFATIRDGFLRRYHAHWPGEATTLGLHAFDGQLKDLSPETIEDELQLHRSSKASLQQLNMASLSVEERLDAQTMTALHDFHIRFVGETQSHRINVLMSLYPYQLLQFQRRLSKNEQQWADVSTRVAKIPRYLKQQEALLAQAAQAGQTPDIDVVAFLADNQIPHALTFFESFAQQAKGTNFERGEIRRRDFHTRCLAAARAYAAHRKFLLEVVCPKAAIRTLGEEEYAWRLKTTLGVEASVGESIEQARDILNTLCDRLIQIVGSMNNGKVESVQEALAFVMHEKKTPVVERDEDVIDAYRGIHLRAQKHMRAHALFHFGDEVDSLGFQPVPPASAEIGAAANIAAPLLDPNGQAFFLVQPRAAAHAQIQAAVLAVHEGIPGHALQSIWWQSHPDRRAHPVRFLNVPDEVAVARQYFGSMMNIEGWATYAEVLMAEHDFFNPREQMWATWCQMAHASRVVVDASVHTNRMTVAEGIAFMNQEAGWPLEWATVELNRYRQVPLQAVCYLLGRLEILKLRERCRKKSPSTFCLADFHERLFAAGPVAAGHLQQAWFPGD